MDTKDAQKTITTTEHEKAFRRALRRLQEGKPLIETGIRLHKDYKAIATVCA